MRKVIGIGETVLDIIFKNNQPDTAAPGGSTFNSMVSLGRAGVSAYFISEVGNNQIQLLPRCARYPPRIQAASDTDGRRGAVRLFLRPEPCRKAAG